MGKSNQKLLHTTYIAFLTVLCVFTTSCGLNPKKYFSKKVNLAGVITHEPSSYAPVETGTFRVSSDELINRRDHKGNKTTLLWGLFTYTDY